MSRVREFHLIADQPAPEYAPIYVQPDMARFRMRLITEEYKEVMAELAALAQPQSPDQTIELLRKLLKELADLRYVLEGTAVSLGLPIDEAFADVHRSNMSKRLPDGTLQKDPGGKVLKGPNYKPPDMSKFVPGIIDNI